jgi:hypothetical protein
VADAIAHGSHHENGETYLPDELEEVDPDFPVPEEAAGGAEEEEHAGLLDVPEVAVEELALGQRLATQRVEGLVPGERHRQCRRTEKNHRHQPDARRQTVIRQDATKPQ